VMNHDGALRRRRTVVSQASKPGPCSLGLSRRCCEISPDGVNVRAMSAGVDVLMLWAYRGVSDSFWVSCW
jgi:hypothetical protein